MKIIQVTDDNHFACILLAADEESAIKKCKELHFSHDDDGEDDDLEEGDDLVAYEVEDGAALDNDGPVTFY